MSDIDREEDQAENARFELYERERAEQLNNDNQPEPKHYFVSDDDYDHFCKICGNYITHGDHHRADEIPAHLKFQAE